MSKGETLKTCLHTNVIYWHYRVGHVTESVTYPKAVTSAVESKSIMCIYVLFARHCLDARLFY